MALFVAVLLGGVLLLTRQTGGGPPSPPPRAESLALTNGDLGPAYAPIEGGHRYASPPTPRARPTATPAARSAPSEPISTTVRSFYAQRPPQARVNAVEHVVQVYASEDAARVGFDRWKLPRQATQPQTAVLPLPTDGLDLGDEVRAWRHRLFENEFTVLFRLGPVLVETTVEGYYGLAGREDAWQEVWRISRLAAARVATQLKRPN